MNVLDPFDAVDTVAVAGGGVTLRRDDQASRLREMVGRGAPARPARPVSPARPAAEAWASGTIDRPADRSARVIAVTSGKGGVGKTNLAVNLAARFAQAGRRTVLLDADMGLANADVLCGLNLKRNLAHVVAGRCRIADVLADAPGGFSLAAGATGLEKMADLAPAEHLRLLDELATLERAADLILVDTGAGISPNVLTFTRNADHILIVTTPEPTAVTDAYATAKVIVRGRQRRGEAATPISVVVNNARTPREAGETFDRLSRVAREFLGAELTDAGFVPSDPAVGRAVRARRPFVVGQPRCPASVAVTRLAVRLEAGVADALPPGSLGGGFFSRLADAVRAKVPVPR